MKSLGINAYAHSGLQRKQTCMFFEALFCHGCEHGILPEASASTSPVCLV